MYSAYAKIEVARKLPDISALAAHESQEVLFGGLKNGSLLQFKRNESSPQTHDCQVYKHFEKKTVVDLEVITEPPLILSLSNGQLTAHSSSDQFKEICSITQYSLLSAFATHVTENKKLFIAASAKRQIHIFEWIVKFEEIRLTLNPPVLLDNPQIIRWCAGCSLFFATKTDFCYVKVFPDDSINAEENIGSIQTIAPRTGDHGIVSLTDRKLVGICRGQLIEFFTHRGERSTSISSIKFSEAPIALAYDHPYLLAVLGDAIEVRSVFPSMLVQKIKFDRPALISVGIRGTVFVSSIGAIYELASRPQMKSNVQQLVRDKQFDLAYQLTELCDSMTPKEKIEVKRKTAANFFAQKRYEECFRIYKEENTNLLLVLHLFPSLIPEKFRGRATPLAKEAHDFMPCPDFAPNEWKQAEIELARYLSELRTREAQILDAHRKSNGELLNTPAQKAHEDVLELADSVLLKCYLKNSPSFVPSLLRLRDNRCNVDEAAKDLWSAERHDDLYLLYSKKNIRRKALEILKQQARKLDSNLFGPEETIRYLQTLGPSNFDLIKEFSCWVLAANPEQGVKIFCTDDCDTVRQLNRDEVYSFLEKECLSAVIPYLEHVIFKWKDERPNFHEALAGFYVAKVKKLMNDYVHALGDNESLPRGGAEDGDLGAYRKKLNHFLEFSTKYNAAAVAQQLDNSLMQERAIVLGRLGKHEEALLIYAHVLMDYDLAEKYCERYYDPKSPDIFIILFKAYTNPTLLPAAAEMTGMKQAQPKVSEALKLLSRHPTQMDPVEAIRLLPAGTPIAKVYPAIEAIVEATKDKCNSLEMHAVLSERTVQKQQSRLAEIKAEKIVIDNVRCIFCSKFISSAFVKFRDGRIADYHCYNNVTAPKLSPNRRLSSRHRTASSIM